MYEILNQGPLYKALRKLKIGGFGFYDTFMHIDTRAGKITTWNNTAYRVPKGIEEVGKLAVFDPGRFFEALTRALHPEGGHEDGLRDWIGAFGAVVVVCGVVIFKFLTSGRK